MRGPVFFKQYLSEMHTAEPLVPDPSPFEVEIAVGNLKRY
jgi:hypothetical protein